jgi:arylformamidase
MTDSINSTRSLVDLSHLIEDGMTTYPGLPGPVICDFLSRADSPMRYGPGTEFQIGKIEMIGNTGTYIDSPFHRYAAGADLADLPLAAIANLECVVVRVATGHQGAIARLPLRAADVRGRAILVHTGWDRHWRTPQYGEQHPHLSAKLGEWLAAAGAALVGIDSMNIDGTATWDRPVHTTLLGQGIPIVEHLRGLGAVPDRGARFFAVPPRLRAFGTFPIRAFALC